MMKIADISFGAPVKKPLSTTEPEREFTGMEELFRSVVRGNPDGEALAGGGTSLAFGELDAFSERIARFILARGYGREAVVGVLCERGATYLAAALGVMRAGAVYLPVEREQPRARKEIMLRPASLIIADSANLREAEHLRYRNPRIMHVLCLDAPDFYDVMERNTGLSSTEYWEHLAEPGSDRGWRSDFGGGVLSDATLACMARAVVEKCGLAERTAPRVLDVGSGSGLVARALAAVAGEYAAVDLARNELDRVSRFAVKAEVKTHRIEAADIRFFEGRAFDCIVLNGVAENFPGYNYLRRVLDHALSRLDDGGVLFVGAVRDLDARDDLRAALKEYALATGEQAGLPRFEASEELFVPRRFFTEWAAESASPVTAAFSACIAEQGQSRSFRYDVVIRKGRADVAARPARFGLRHLPPRSENPLPACRPEQAAYIVYTSGSTGVPKGVVVEHRNLMHILRALRPYAKGCERVALVAPLSFDASVQQLAVSVFCGKSLYVASDEERKNPALFCECARARRIDLCDMTPAFFNVLTEHLSGGRSALPLKRLLLAGEVLRPDVIRRFYDIAGNEQVVLFNIYGPTECTVDSTAFRIDATNYAAFTSYPIGRPLEGVNIAAVDGNGAELPDSTTGELWIWGDGVSRGYLDGASPGAFVLKNGQRSYRTGDKGFVRGGVAYYRGREDQQVKIRGNRVEIGEVEKAVAAFPGVRQVAVVADVFRSGGEKSLAAYVEGNVDMASLRDCLARQLPPYCVPDYFVPMAELPLSLNRKVDRKALPSPLGRVETPSGRKPTGPVEEKLAAIWKRLLGMDVRDAEADFFSMGGHSILAIRLLSMIEREMDVRLAVADLVTHSTIAQLAGLLAGKTGARDSPVIRLSQCAGGKNIFLFHPVGGSVFCYGDLARLLGEKYTVYAVEAAGFSTEKNALNTELQRVEGLAEYYLDEILKVESGNIIFGGWSFGGLVAYEAACRYAAQGHAPEPVIILDSVADNTRARQVAAKDDVDMLKIILRDALTVDERKLRGLPREEKLRYLVECGEKSGLLPSGFSPVQMDNLLQTYRCNAVAAARYERPTPSDHEMLFVRALDFSDNSYIVLDDDYQGWSRSLKKENITLRWAEGTHESMLSSGLAGGVAGHILEYLARRG